MSTPQTAIQLASSECMTIARSLLAHGEMLSIARPDSAIVKQAIVSLRSIAVRIDNQAISLQQALLAERDEV